MNIFVWSARKKMTEITEEERQKRKIAIENFMKAQKKAKKGQKVDKPDPVEEGLQIAEKVEKETTEKPLLQKIKENEEKKKVKEKQQELKNSLLPKKQTKKTEVKKEKPKTLAPSKEVKSDPKLEPPPQPPQEQLQQLNITVPDFTFIKSSSDNINTLLNGGFKYGTCYAFWGRQGRGKTNLALDLAFNASEHGKKILYLDADGQGGVHYERLIGIIKERKLSVATKEQSSKFREALQKENDDRKRARMLQRFIFKGLQNIGINIVKVRSLKELSDIITRIDNYDVVIIDSLTLHYKNLLTMNLGIKGQYGGGEIQTIAKIIHLMMVYAQKHNAIIVHTLQRRSDIGKEERRAGLDTERDFVGTEATAYNVDVIIELLLDKDGARRARLDKNRTGPQGQCMFNITNGGVN